VTLGYLFGANISDPDPEHGAKLYEAYPAMRRSYEQVRDWTGIEPRALLRGEFEPRGDHDRFSLAGIRLAALAFGIHDVLAESDIHPGVAGGISLGGLIASAIAGAVDRRTLFDLLVREAKTPVPDPAPPAQGAAIAFLPVTEDPTFYYGERRPGVYLGGDFGVLSNGTARLLMLSGTAEALDKLVVQSQPGMISVIDGQPFAVHSPLRQYATDFMAPTVAAMAVTDPRIPVCSFLEERALTTADEVRDLFQRNKTTTMSLPHVCAGMKDQGVRLAFVLGPTLPAGVLDFPFPVVRITEPHHVTEAMTAIYDYAVDLVAPSA
jgi:[acyl-carrier-protein] S-malonyltransferase